MEAKERIRKAYEYLRSTGQIHTQQNVADIMGVKKENISRAFNGNESYLTTNFMERFNSAFGEIFNIEWLTKGQGDMLKPIQSVGDISNSNVSGVNVNGQEIHIYPDAYNTLLKIVETNQRTTEKFQEQIDRLISIIENKYGTTNR